jgi:sortase A
MLMLERLAWSAGIVGVGFWLVAAADRRISSAQEIARFAALRAEGKLPGDPPDQKLWSPLRVKEWEEARTRETPLPVAVLSIKRIGLEVPVLQGTDDWTLNRAVGVIEDTPLPGSPGNSGIAGHRDSFFRVLKDVVTGDLMTVETARATETYRIERIWIVDPDDVSVLDPTESPSITLVTCYPFYFVGSAPQRYIVRAVRHQNQ